MVGRLLGMGRVWDPCAEMERIHDEVSRLVLGARWVHPEAAEPPVNVWVSAEEIVVTAEVPGATPQDLEISVAGETLSLRGSRPTSAMKEGDMAHQRERQEGGFARTVQLPFRVEAEQVSARLKDGIVWITLPRAEADKPKRITVTSA